MILLRLLLCGEMRCAKLEDDCQADWLLTQASQADVLYDKYGAGYLVTLPTSYLTSPHQYKTHHWHSLSWQYTVHSTQHTLDFVCFTLIIFSGKNRFQSKHENYWLGPRLPVWSKNLQKEISSSGIIITSAGKLKWWIKHNSYYQAKVSETGCWRWWWWWWWWLVCKAVIL